MKLGKSTIERNGKVFEVDVRTYINQTFFGDVENYSVYINGELTILSPNRDGLDELIENAITSMSRKK